MRATNFLKSKKAPEGASTIIAGRRLVPNFRMLNNDSLAAVLVARAAIDAFLTVAICRTSVRGGHVIEDAIKSGRRALHYFIQRRITVDQHHVIRARAALADNIPALGPQGKNGPGIVLGNRIKVAQV